MIVPPCRSNQLRIRHEVIVKTHSHYYYTGTSPHTRGKEFTAATEPARPPGTPNYASLVVLHALVC